MDFADIFDNDNGNTVPVGLLQGGEFFDDIEGERRDSNI